MLGHKVDELAGLELAGAVVRDAGSDLNFAAVNCRQHDHGGLEFVFELVHGLAQSLGVSAFEPRSKHLQALDIDRLQHQLIALRRGQLAFEGAHFLFQRTYLIEHLGDAMLQLRGAGLERRRRSLHGGLQRLQVRQRVGARHRLDAAHAGSDPAFRDDLEQPDVAGAAHMRAAAKLLAGANAQHPHALAILLAKEHHGAGFLRRFQVHDGGIGGFVLQDFSVHPRFDVANLRVGQRRVVRKVKARALGIHQAAFLLDMRAQHFA